MIIALDADEILSAFIDRFLIFHNKNFGTRVKKEEVLSFELGQLLEITENEVENRIEEFFKIGDARDIKLIDGAKDGVEALLGMDHEIHVITARPLILKDETLRWLDEHFYNKFKGIHFAFNPYVKESRQKTKAEICREINAEIMVEDHIVNAVECAKVGIKVLLMDTPWNQIKNLPDGLVRVKSWGDILREVKQ